MCIRDRYYTQAAERGYSMAMYNLACLYLDGRGVEQDSISAMEWMLRAAERGNAYAQVKLAWMLEKGVGIRKDYDEAAKWYLAGSRQGLALGQINLALLLASGAVGETDLVGAYKWMKLAAQTGNQGAEKFLPTIREKMSPEELAEAELLITRFVAQPYTEEIPPGTPQG